MGYHDLMPNPSNVTPHIKWRVPAHVQRMARIRAAQLEILPGEYITRLIEREYDEAHTQENGGEAS